MIQPNEIPIDLTKTFEVNFQVKITGKRRLWASLFFHRMLLHAHNLISWITGHKVTIEITTNNRPK